MNIVSIWGRKKNWWRRYRAPNLEETYWPIDIKFPDEISSYGHVAKENVHVEEGDSCVLSKKRG